MNTQETIRDVYLHPRFGHEMNNQVHIVKELPRPTMHVVEGCELGVFDPIEQTVLTRHRHTLHIPYEFLISSGNVIEGLHFVAMVKVASELAQEVLDREQGIYSEHPLCIHSVHVTKQPSSLLMVIEVNFLAVRADICNIGMSLLERTLNKLLVGDPVDRIREEFTDIFQHHMSANNLFANNLFEKIEYTEDAEEIAHELLKGIVTKKQFETYRDEGYLVVKGTYGRIYKIIKGQMIEVTQKIKGSKTKKYSLCIEPRDRGTICPTDEVVAKYKLIQADEKMLHKIANKFEDTFEDRFTIMDQWCQGVGDE